MNYLMKKSDLTFERDVIMAEIFPKDGFPQKFIDDIVGEVELIDAPKEDNDG